MTRKELKTTCNKIAKSVKQSDIFTDKTNAALVSGIALVAGAIGFALGSVIKKHEIRKIYKHTVPDWAAEVVYQDAFGNPFSDTVDDAFDDTFSGTVDDPFVDDTK